MKLIESETVELKRSLAETPAVLETISAFSNTKGGTIYIGIEEDKDGSAKKMVGVNIKGREIEILVDRIRQNTDPVVYPSVGVEEIESVEVIVIKVEESPFKPVFAKRNCFKRVGKSNRRLTSEEIRRMSKDSVGHNITELVCEDATLDDIDEEKVRMFLRKAKVERNFAVDLEASLEENLERLKLFKNGKLLNAAILLFGKNPQDFLLQARVRCARYKGTTAIDFIDLKVLEGDIIDQVNTSEKFVLSHIKKAAKIVLFKREEVWEYPPDALREAIVNAICHRDYSFPGNVKIAVYDDRVEITSPGGLPEPLTPAKLKKRHDSIPRNRLIANNFFLIRNIEQWGTGTNKIVKWCVEHGLEEPDFKNIGGGFEVLFYAPRDILALIPEKGKIDLKEMGLNERQIEVLKLMVNGNKSMTNKEYRRLFDVSDRTALRELKALLDKKLVKRVGKRKGAIYVAK